MFSNAAQTQGCVADAPCGKQTTAHSHGNISQQLQLSKCRNSQGELKHSMNEDSEFPPPPRRNENEH